MGQTYMELGSAINLLLQFPLLGIFVWFVLKMLASFQHTQEKRDREWQEFLREQRMASNGVIEKLASEIENISGLLIAHDQRAQTHNLQMQEHDVRAREAVPRIMQAIERQSV